jgi:outer membrane protein assembly factor BamB
MWTLDLDDGSVESRTSFDSQWESYLAPTIKDGHVFTNGGTYGGMYSFRGIDGTRRWFAHLQQYDLWTPAVDERYAYAHTGYELAIVDRRNGARVASIPNTSFNWRGYALNIAPVLPGDGSVLVVDGIYNFESPHNNGLIRYDVETRTESWRIGGSFVSNPVVAAGRVYALDSVANRLEARDVSTGALLWSWVVPDAQESLPVGNMIVTNNLIFLCTTAATYAIDLNTRAVVWREPKVGHLALSSNKVLYIVAPRRIDAFDLD